MAFAVTSSHFRYELRYGDVVSRRHRRARVGADAPDLRTSVGSVELRNPVMTASGTAGHADELGRYVDLSALGAVVVKSLAATAWPGNPPPRVHETPAGMLNSVGLQGGGVEHWLESELPRLIEAGATVVASIWGTDPEGYAKAAATLASAAPSVVAVEVNVSCPNHHAGGKMFAHSPSLTAEAVEASTACGRPVWCKLSPNVADLPEIAAAAWEAGAAAVTLINTVPGLVIDLESRQPLLARGKGGGLSGPAIHPIAVRAVYDVHAALPELPIVGVGGVAKGEDAVELLLAGASAVQVGTATFVNPRAVLAVLQGLEDWCTRHGVCEVRELIGGAHG
ncbi:MAG: dihydroorotate dehydrogenase [Acidimicrobiales bacterium]|nr:dihydroorotate dehydrogenase [Acidimicrobiales bacterium]